MYMHVLAPTRCCNLASEYQLASNVYQRGARAPSLRDSSEPWKQAENSFWNAMHRQKGFHKALHNLKVLFTQWISL
jgi:hypothetical protein